VQARVTLVLARKMTSWAWDGSEKAVFSLMTGGSPCQTWEVVGKEVLALMAGGPLANAPRSPFQAMDDGSMSGM
jgi:hypothetical protein